MQFAQKAALQIDTIFFSLLVGLSITSWPKGPEMYKWAERENRAAHLGK